MGSLKNNLIYKELQKRNSTSLLKMIDDTFAYCKDYLGEIPKEFSNYTLHDIEHALRVIEYMTVIVEDKLDELSDLHLAMIILSGLLHDVGMVVSDSEKKEISKQWMSLCEDERNLKVQEYIRNHHAERVKDVIENNCIDGTAKLKSLFRVGKSYNISDDIADICRSHNENCSWIRKNIRNVAHIATFEFNPQQIALLLRLGDNLDIDDRRAPYYLLSPLNIEGYSKTEWDKHIQVTNYDKIRKENDSYVIFLEGSCGDPAIYRKLLTMIDWLQEDYVEINSLATQFPIPYTFHIFEKIDNRIASIGFDAKPYKFSLDYEKVVNLLMGEKIYGSKKAGLRELVQNSIDAVMIMKEKLQTVALSNYTPTILIELNKDSNIVSITDNGIGMTEAVIEKYFFNIGTSYYKSEEFKQYRLNYSTIGHYGIGFLACFMLSSHVSMITKSSEESVIDIEFEKDSSYSTRRKMEDCPFPEGHGTKISLGYNDTIGRAFKSEDDVIEYLKETFLPDGYKLIVNNNGTIIEIKSLFKDENADFQSTENIEMSCKGLILPDLISSCRDLVEEDQFLFYYYGEDPWDSDSFISVGYFLDCLEEIDAEVWGEIPDDIQLAGDSLSENFNSWKNKKRNSDQALLNKIYNDGYISLSKVPFIKNKNLLANFLEFVEKNGYKKAVKQYKSFFDYFYFIYNDNITSEIIAQMANYAVENLGGDAYYEEDEYSNYFTFETEQIMQEVHNYKNVYIPIERGVELRKKYKNLKEKVYMRGILVPEEHLILPYLIKGTGLEKICVNIKSDSLNLDISREKFDSESKEALGKIVAKTFLETIIQKDSTLWVQKEIIALNDYLKKAGEA